MATSRRWPSSGSSARRARPFPRPKGPPAAALLLIAALAALAPSATPRPRAQPAADPSSGGPPPRIPLAKPEPAPPGAAWLPGAPVTGPGGRRLPVVLTPPLPDPSPGSPAALSPLAPPAPGLVPDLNRGQGLPFTLTVMRRGTAIEFSGTIVPGAARALEAVLRGSGRDAQVLHLTGPGGIRGEAIRMAALVSRYRLDTFVRSQCNSACTMVFLAGRRRVIQRGAILGFHRGTPVGLRPDQTDGVPLGAELRNAFRHAGIPRWFLDRVDATPPDMLWVPTPEELLEARYIHRVTDGEGFSAGLPPVRAGLADMPDLFRRASPLAAAVARLYPGILPAAAGEVLPAYNDGAAPEELQSLVLRAALPAAFALLPQAPDAEALVALGALGIIAQAAALSAPELCPALAAGGALRVSALAGLTGPARAVRDEALSALPAVLQAATGPARATPPSPDALAAPLARLGARLGPKLAPAQRAAAARLLHLAAPAATAPRRPAATPQPRHHCEAMAAVHAEIATMPPPEAGLLARHLLALGR